MAHWLLKTEPSDYSFQDLVAEKRVVWSGVSNAAALKNMRAMQKGDEVLIYHTGEERAVVGRAKIVKGPPARIGRRRMTDRLDDVLAMEDAARAAEFDEIIG